MLKDVTTGTIFLGTDALQIAISRMVSRNFRIPMVLFMSEKYVGMALIIRLLNARMEILSTVMDVLVNAR